MADPRAEDPIHLLGRLSGGPPRLGPVTGCTRAPGILLFSGEEPCAWPWSRASDPQEAAHAETTRRRLRCVWVRCPKLLLAQHLLPSSSVRRSGRETFEPALLESGGCDAPGVISGCIVSKALLGYPQHMEPCLILMSGSDGLTGPGSGL